MYSYRCVEKIFLGSGKRKGEAFRPPLFPLLGASPEKKRGRPFGLPLSPYFTPERTRTCSGPFPSFFKDPPAFSKASLAPIITPSIGAFFPAP